MLPSITNIFIFIFIFIILDANYLVFTTRAQPQPPKHIATILGSVYCDVCNHNTFSTNSYFLPGVDLNVECKVKARSARSARSREDISLSVNTSTDRYGMYKVDFDPNCVGMEEREGEDYCTTIHSLIMCKAKLISSASASPPCNLAKTISSHKIIKLRSKQSNACIYTLGALSYTPPRRNATLCGNQTQTQNASLCVNQTQASLLREEADSWNTSKFFLPYIPPYVFPWPQLPPLPPWPQLPPLPQLPPFPYFPFPPNPNPPNLPFPFPSIPPLPPSAAAPAPPINFWDPRTWIPQPPPPAATP